MHSKLARTARPPAIGAILAAGATAALLQLGACGTVPPAHYPEFREFTIDAEYEPANGRVLLPMSSPDLVVFELSFTPATAREEFADGERRVELPADCPLLHVHCRCRAYAGSDGRVPTPSTLFPGARILLPSP
jgi:hypothetical protein